MTKLLVSPGNIDGPNPNDYVNLLVANVEFSDDNRQPWKDYDHIEEYLPGVEFPETP